MKLILEIDTETGKNTGNGDCPCCYWDKPEEAYRCTVAEEDCMGVLGHRPKFCPLKEEERGETNE